MGTWLGEGMWGEEGSSGWERRFCQVRGEKSLCSNLVSQGPCLSCLAICSAPPTQPVQGQTQQLLPTPCYPLPDMLFSPVLPSLSHSFCPGGRRSTRKQQNAMPAEGSAIEGSGKRWGWALRKVWSLRAGTGMSRCGASGATSVLAQP